MPLISDPQAVEEARRDAWQAALTARMNYYLHHFNDADWQ